MATYLNDRFDDIRSFAETYDELPLWSASFGLLLLKHLELKPGLTVVDMGSGAGFPVLELAGRLGHSCTLYGIDIWTNANERARKKIKNYELRNVEIIESPAEKTPFADNAADLVVSNLGINNFAHPPAVFRECHRILKPGGKLVLTTNLYGHWKEFYRIFKETLAALGKNELLENLKREEAHRATLESISVMFAEAGFRVCKTVEEQFEMRFLDGSAFLNHYFVRLGWLSAWKNLFPESEQLEIFQALEQNLNASAQKTQGLLLTVPMAYVEGENAGDAND